MRLRRSTITDRYSQQSLRRRLEQVIDRQEAIEQDLVLLQNTLKAIAREEDLSISGPCSKCEQCLLFIRRRELSCPKCGYRRSL